MNCVPAFNPWNSSIHCFFATDHDIKVPESCLLPCLFCMFGLLFPWTTDHLSKLLIWNVCSYRLSNLWPSWTELSNRNIMWATYTILQFLVATLKRKIGEINFNIFYLTDIQNIISTCNQYNNFNEIFYILFLVLSLQNLVCILHLEHISIQTCHIANAQ